MLENGTDDLLGIVNDLDQIYILWTNHLFLQQAVFKPFHHAAQNLLPTK